MKDLDGRVAVVTGAASGIGRALADAFVAEGMKVVLADVEVPALDAAVQEFADAGADVIGVRTDVSKPEDVQALADRTIEAFGAVHVLCNNAGVESGGPFEEVPLEVWDWVLGVNFRGVLHGCQTFLPLLQQQEEGHIVNTASISALAGYPDSNTPYVTSKFAVLGLTENLRHQLVRRGSNVGVSVMCPGLVATNILYAERNLPEGVPTMDVHPDRLFAVEQGREIIATLGYPPADLAASAVEAIRSGRFFILTDADEAIAAFEARLRWLTDDVPPPPLWGV